MSHAASIFVEAIVEAANAVQGTPLAGLSNVHSDEDCDGHHCSIHNPSDHHMRDWPLNWRADRYLMERICPHGVGHPDPDHLARSERLHGKEHADAEGVHGCDGCCREAA